ncbi:MAG: hypothetical protein F4X65_14235 [Chloroflexi bacterium]|nr:hypothetical protein [Chloroflexota bacterium]
MPRRPTRSIRSIRSICSTRFIWSNRPVQSLLIVLLVLYMSVGFAPPSFAQGVPIHLGENTEYVGPRLWAILQRHSDGGAVPDYVVVEIGYRDDLEVGPPLEEFIISGGGEKIAEYTWRIPTGNVLPVIQRPDLLYMAQPEEATEGGTGPYPTMDDTLNDIVVAYTGGVTGDNAVRYAMFVREESVVLEVKSPDEATVEIIREWLTRQGVYVPPPGEFTAFSDDFLVALVPVSRLATLAEAFPNTYLSVSTHAGQGLPLDRAQWPAEALELEESVTAGYLPPQQGQATPEPGLLPTVTPLPPVARYDGDGDGLIEVMYLEQLDAIRHDLDGDGNADDGPEADAYASAYPVSGEEVVCNDCHGYELARPLDFGDAGSNASGVVSAEWTTGVGWQPIGDGWNPFAATFNGNGHAISNLYITPAVRPDASSVHGFGLFGTVGESGVVRDTGLLNASVKGGDFVGPLAGSNRGRVSHSYATGSVSGYGCVGGLVGSNDSGLISYSHASGSVSGGFKYLGGLAGCNNSGTIIASYATGSVSGDIAVGGLVGENYGWIITSYAAGSVRGQKYVGGLVGAHGDGQISASYSVSDVTGGHYIGGLIGGNESIVVYSYAVGRVSGDGAIDAPLQYIGGLVGYNPGIITSSYWDTDTSGQQVGIGIEIGDGLSSNVLGMTTDELQSPEGYTGPYQEWEVTLGIEGWGTTPHYTLSDFWDFGTVSDYPALKVDFDTDGTATWPEFGDQRGSAPDTAKAPTVESCVELMDGPIASGAWSRNCASGSRPGSYARFYTFTLTDTSEVTIDLESGDSDTYLYLLQGGGKTAQALAGQGSSSRSSRIDHVLGPGTYTIEATTYESGQTGSFTLTVNRFSAPLPPPTNMPAPASPPPPPDKPAPIPTATLPPTPSATPVPAPTSAPMKPADALPPAATATPARESASDLESVSARESAGTCSYPVGNTPGDAADISLFLLAAPLTLTGWLKFGSRRRGDR